MAIAEFCASYSHTLLRTVSVVPVPVPVLVLAAAAAAAGSGLGGSCASSCGVAGCGGDIVIRADICLGVGGCCCLLLHLVLLLHMGCLPRGERLPRWSGFSYLNLLI